MVNTVCLIKMNYGATEQSAMGYLIVLLQKANHFTAEQVRFERIKSFAFLNISVNKLSG